MSISESFIIFALILQLLCGIIPLAFSHGESYSTILDIEAIEESIPNLHRPDFLGIPHLLQEISSNGKFTIYKWLGEGSTTSIGVNSNAKTDSTVNAGVTGLGYVLFNRTADDEGLPVIIFKSGEYNFGPRLNRTYIVLRRHSTQGRIYFINIVYVRNEGHNLIVEWESFNTKREGKTKAEKDLCQNEDCDFPEEILGTCPIVSHKCKEKFGITPEQMEYKPFMIPEEHGQLLPWILDENDENRQKRQSKRNRKRSIGTYNSELNNSISNVNVNFTNSNATTTQIQQNSTKPTHRPHIPNSFDLLEMEIENNGSDVGFKNSVKRRFAADEGVSASQQKIQDNFHGNPYITCFDCSRLGSFFNNLEENPMYSEAIATDFKREFQDITLWANPPSFSSIVHQVPFIGYGNCTYNAKLSRFKRPKSHELDDICQFYLSILRVDCHDSFLNELKSWLTSKLKFLRIQQDMSLGLVFSSPLLTYNLLSSSEFELLVSAVIFSKFTVSYIQEINFSEVELRALNPAGLQLSQNMKFLTRLILEILETVRQHLRHHFIKFTWKLIRQLKNKFYTLILEKISGGGPGTGGNEIVNYSDRLQVQGLKEFLLYGLGPVVKSRTSTYMAFSSFYYLNSARIRFLVDSYKVD